MRRRGCWRSCVGLVVGRGPGWREPRPSAGPPGAAACRRPPAALRQQVGQLLVSSFDGATAPAYMRRRLRAGETAGVILFGRERRHGRGAGARLTRALQRDARGAALVMVDQEGGAVRSVPFAGPQASQPAQGGPAQVRATGAAAGRAAARRSA